MEILKQFSEFLSTLHLICRRALTLTYDANMIEGSAEEKKHNSCQWTFCMFTTRRMQSDEWIVIVIIMMMCIMFLFTNFVHLSSGLWEPFQCDACAHVFEAHIHGALSPMHRGFNAYVLAAIAMPMTAPYNGIAAAAAFSLLFTAYTIRFGFIFFPSILSNAKHIFYTSNTCITCCLTFYSRQCSVSFCCCCFDACICATNANSYMYAYNRFVLHAFACSFHTFQMI